MKQGKGLSLLHKAPIVPIKPIESDPTKKFITTWETTTANESIIIPIDPSISYFYDVETSDGQVIRRNRGNVEITFETPGFYDVSISGFFPKCFFSLSNNTNRAKIKDIKQFGIYGKGSINQSYAFYGCYYMDISAADLGHFGDVVDFSFAWMNIVATSFPLIDTSSGVNFESTWEGCNFTSFPLIDTSSGVNFESTWEGCNDLTSFPLLDTSKGVSFKSTWQGCNFTSFPLIDVSNGIDFTYTWSICTSLTSFPLLNVSKGVIFNSTWWGCHSLLSFPQIDFNNAEIFSATWAHIYADIPLSISISYAPKVTILDYAFTGSAISSISLPDMNDCTSFFDAFESANLTTISLGNMNSMISFEDVFRGLGQLVTFSIGDVSSATSLKNAWNGNTSMTSFSIGNTSNVSNFERAWTECSALTSFPLIDTSNGTNFEFTWFICMGLTNFPVLDVSNGTTFLAAWAICPFLSSFPPNMFDNVISADYSTAFLNSGLSEQSVNGVLISIDTSGQENETITVGGAAPTGAGLTAKNNLINKGWTVTTS